MKEDEKRKGSHARVKERPRGRRKEEKKEKRRKKERKKEKRNGLGPERKKKEKRKERELVWALTKPNSFGLLNILAQDLLGPISGTPKAQAQTAKDTHQ
jgi:hypothetical protein